MVLIVAVSVLLVGMTECVTQYNTEIHEEKMAEIAGAKGLQEELVWFDGDREVTEIRFDGYLRVKVNDSSIVIELDTESGAEK